MRMLLEETRATLELLKDVQAKVLAIRDLKSNNQVNDDLGTLISALESPIFQSVLNIQDSLRELKRQVQFHPSILPADFDINQSGELILNAPLSSSASGSDTTTWSDIEHQNGANGNLTDDASQSKMGFTDNGIKDITSPVEYGTVQDSQLEGDQVMSIDDQKAKSMLQSTKGSAHLRNESLGCVFPSNWCHVEVIELANEGHGLGFGIDGKQPRIIVKAIILGGVASVDGRLKVGDFILQINEHWLQGINTEKVENILKGSGDKVRLVVARAAPDRLKIDETQLNIPILPASTLANQKELETYLQIALASTATPLNEAPLSPSTSLVKGMVSSTPAEKVSITHQATKAVDQNLAPGSTVLSGMPEMETLEVQLVKDSRGLGITIAGYTCEGEELSGIFIKSVSNGSPAFKSGKVAVNDQIVEVDGKSLQGHTNLQAVEMLRNTGMIVNLKLIRYVRGVKFEQLHQIIASSHSSNLVTRPSKLITSPLKQATHNFKADCIFSDDSSKSTSKSFESPTNSIMWSEENINIELANGERGLGFSIIDVQDPMSKEKTVIVIRGLFPGGVAQQDGRLKPGDRLLHVNEVNLEYASLDEAFQALKKAQTGIVKIGVLKSLAIPDSFGAKESQAKELQLTGSCVSENTEVHSEMGGLNTPEQHGGLSSVPELPSDYAMKADMEDAHDNAVEIIRQSEDEAVPSRKGMMESESVEVTSENTNGGEEGESSWPKMSDSLSPAPVDLSKEQDIETNIPVEPPPEFANESTTVNYDAAASIMKNTDGDIKVIVAKPNPLSTVEASVQIKAESKVHHIVPAPQKEQTSQTKGSYMKPKVTIKPLVAPKPSGISPAHTTTSVVTVSTQATTEPSATMSTLIKTSTAKTAPSVAKINFGKPVAFPRKKRDDFSNNSKCKIVPGSDTIIEITKGTDQDGKPVGLGLSIVGGSDTLLGAIFIHEIYEKGAAHKDGRLRPGDQILEVMHENLRDVNHSYALHALRQTPSRVRLVIHREHDDAYQCFEVELHKKRDKALGLSIVGKKFGPGIFISEVAVGGTAASDGRLIQGDQIISVNGHDLTNSSREDAALVLKKASGKLQIKARRLRASKSKGQQQQQHARMPINPVISGTPKVIHIHKGEHGLGFSIVGDFGSPHGDTPIYVKAVFEKGAAAEHGALKRGDLITAVNGLPLKDMTHQDVVNLLKNCDGNVTLNILS